MRLMFVFMLGLFLCTSLAAKEKKPGTFEDETQGLEKVEECYVGGDYFVFLYICNDDLTYKCFLVKWHDYEYKICAKVKFSTACLFFPYLDVLKTHYISSASFSEFSRQPFSLLTGRLPLLAFENLL
jgi:hypothetical protein